MEDFVTYEQAVKLKELGFDCHNLYNQMYYATQNYCEGNNPFFFDTIGPGDLISSPKMKEDENDGWIEDEDYCVLAPTLAQAQKWLREVKDIIIVVDFDNWCEKYGCHVYKKIIYNSENIKDSYGSMLVTNESNEDFDAYEAALSTGIDKALEILKEQDNGNK